MARWQEQVGDLSPADYSDFDRLLTRRNAQADRNRSKPNPPTKGSVRRLEHQTGCAYEALVASRKANSPAAVIQGNYKHWKHLSDKLVAARCTKARVTGKGFR